ncbi:MAG: RNA polymerase subunit sigma-70 [Dyadobacter sp. 50-39]|uniref:RNA polymerase sigma factor n=1 Tax=Dyadobacter sp. 50-39 TaxID=1895756 RepID=UPI00095AEC29|nr:sigma-70 family RNA polymerase sigma factor [Dyadobacter sp. 50-39]OJV12588.1 MAG: RNA polymerase subunit sigma-70 [Dyadobacter sp. 50-39]
MSLIRDANQFLNVVDAHKGIIYKVANAYCRDGESRKDLIQEITLQLWLAFPKYDQQFKLTTWMYRIALNVSISFFRKQITRQKISHPLTEEILTMMTDEQSDVDSDFILLHKLIRQLKEFDRALMLLYLEGRSHSEIADILGITASNVSTKVGRIKGQLREKFTSLKS